MSDIESDEYFDDINQEFNDKVPIFATIEKIKKRTGTIEFFSRCL